MAVDPPRVTPELTLLSRVAYRGREVTGPRPRGLLALLAGDLRSGGSTARLVEGLWPEEQPEHPAKALQVIVSRTRAQLGADFIASTPSGYRLSLAHDQVDASAALLHAVAAWRCWPGSLQPEDRPAPHDRARRPVHGGPDRIAVHGVRRRAPVAVGGPLAGMGSCPAPHLVDVVSGRLHVRMDDGSQGEAGPGDALWIAPGHDAWVVGDAPVVLAPAARRTPRRDQASVGCA